MNESCYSSSSETLTLRVRSIKVIFRHDEQKYLLLSNIPNYILKGITIIFQSSPSITGDYLSFTSWTKEAISFQVWCLREANSNKTFTIKVTGKENTDCHHRRMIICTYEWELTAQTLQRTGNDTVNKMEKFFIYSHSVVRTRNVNNKSYLPCSFV